MYLWFKVRWKDCKLSGQRLANKLGDLDAATLRHSNKRRPTSSAAVQYSATICNLCHRPRNQQQVRGLTNCRQQNHFGQIVCGTAPDAPWIRDLFPLEPCCWCAPGLENYAASPVALRATFAKRIPVTDLHALSHPCTRTRPPLATPSPRPASVAMSQSSINSQ